VALRPDSGSWPPLTGLRDHTHRTHHTRQDSSGRVISPTTRTLPDNSQHSQDTNVHAPVGFEPIIPASERPQTYALDRASSWIGNNNNNYTRSNGPIVRSPVKTAARDCSCQTSHCSFKKIVLSVKHLQSFRSDHHFINKKIMLSNLKIPFSH